MNIDIDVYTIGLVDDKLKELNHIRISEADILALAEKLFKEDTNFNSEMFKLKLSIDRVIV